MKTLFKTFAYAAIAALALSSCAKEKLQPADEITGKLVTVHFGTENTDPSTKATLTPDDGETVFQAAWENEDKILISYSYSYNETPSTTTGTWKGNSFEASLPAGKGDWIYDAAYPVPAEDNSVDFGSNRTQKGNAYNSKYDIMIGSAVAEGADAGKDAQGNDIIFEMNRQTAIAYFHFTSDIDESLVSATLKVKDGAIANSAASISEQFKFVAEKSNDLKEINLTFEEGTAPSAKDFQLWFNVLPTSYSSMTLTVETATKTFTISKASTGEYLAGKLYKVSKAVEFRAKPVVSSVSLTNDEITNVLEQHTGTAAYKTVEISSESGTWTGMMYSASTLTYVQLKAKDKSYLLSPEFSQAVKYIKINTASQTTSDRSFYVIPSTTELPTGSYSDSSFGTIYGKSEMTVTGEQELTIALTGDPKQFMIVAMGGTVYINSIDVFFGELPSVAVEGVALNQNTMSLSEGDTATLEPVFTPSNATNKIVTWSSDNEGAATVDNGVVTAVAAGTATITVTTADGGYTATCTVNVTAASTGGGEIVTLFTEGFGKNTGKAREWKDTYKEQGGISSVYSRSTYTITNAKQSKNTVGKTESGLAQSTQNTDAIFEIKGLNVAAYSDLSVSYYWKAVSINGKYSTSLYYSKDGGTTYTEVTKTQGTGATTFVEVTYTLPADAVLSNLCLKVVFNTSNTQAVIDEFVLKGTN